MQASPMKSNFNGGEYSPLIGGRVDQPAYGNGCSILENFLTTTQGPIIRRGGSYYINDTKKNTDRIWLKDFVFNVNQSYMLEFGDFYVRFYTNRGLVLEATKAIAGATKANPCVLNIVGHGYTTGDWDYIAGIVGMTQLNGKMYKITVVDANHISLSDIDGNAVDSTGYSTYVSGGTAARVYTVATPYAVADLTDSLGNFALKFVQSNNVLYIFHGSYQTRKLSRLGNTNWQMSAVSLANGPFQTINADATKTVYASIYASNVSGAANNGAGLIRLTVASTAGLVSGNQVTVKGLLGTVEANGRWTATVVNATHIDLQGSTFTNAYASGGIVWGDVGSTVSLAASAATFAATDVGELFYLEKSITNTLPQWTPGIAVTTGNLYRAGSNTYIALNTATSGTVTPTHTSGVATDGNPGVSWLYMDSGFGIVQISAFTNSTHVSATVISQLPILVVDAANATYRWAHSVFSATLGWPEVGAFFRDRLTLFKGIQAAFSVTSDYENFASKIGGQVTADASILITLPTANPVRWALDINDLIVGTAGDEIVVSEITSTAPLGPSNIRARRQTKFGSRNVDAEVVGYGVLFATRSGQKLRDMRYNWQITGYDSVDLTVWAEHIAKGSDGMQSIVQMCYQSEPYSILWACTSDGKLLAFTYDRWEQVKGWGNHPIGGSGFVESIGCIPSPDGTRDDVWLLVKRTINGVTRRYVEYIVPEFLGQDSAISDAFYVDAGLTYSGAATSVIPGFYHLKNTLVDVLANGGAHPQITIDANGTAMLQFNVTKAQIGLPCPARMRTMRMEAGSQLGTSQGKVKRITHIIMRLVRALGGRYGPDNSKDANGNYARMDELQYRQADGLMDTPPPMLNGDTGRLLWPNGDDYTDGYVEIVNDTPTPMTIVSLMADEKTNEY